MANDVKQVVLIPELDSAEGQFQLLLQTRKHSFNKHIESSARGQFSRGGMVTYACGLGDPLCGDLLADLRPQHWGGNAKAA